MKVIAFQAKGKEVKSGIRNEKLEVRNGNCKLPITSYQLRISILLVLFAGADFIRCYCNGSAFQAGNLYQCLCPQVADLRL